MEGRAMNKLPVSIFAMLLVFGISLPTNAVIWPLQVGQVWKFTVNDSREPFSPWIEELHVLEIVKIDTHDYYRLGVYNHKTGEWEEGSYVFSDNDNVYVYDEGVYKVWPLASMVADHIVVPYGEFDAYYYDEGDWYNYFFPGIGYIAWYQIEETYTVTGKLNAIHPPPPPFPLLPKH